MRTDPNKWGVWSAAEVERRLAEVKALRRKRRVEALGGVVLLFILALSVGAGLYLLTELCEWLRSCN